MLKLALFALVVYGASNIMIFSTIFAKWRKFFGVKSENPGFFGKLFGCFMCLPFWWGVLLSVFMFSPTLELMKDFYSIPKEYLSIFFDGCLGSSVGWLIHTLQEKLEYREEK